MLFRKRSVAKARTRSEFLAQLEREARVLPDAAMQCRRAENKSTAVETEELPKPTGFLGNPEHLAKLKEGAEAWNAWRKNNPAVRPDLKGVDFAGAEDFKGTPIWGRPPWGPTLPERALLDDINLSSADLTLANLSAAYLKAANLRGADLSGANLSDAWLLETNLGGANLFVANLSKSFLSHADLSGAYLERANLSGAFLRGANLSGADLSAANLTNADVTLISYDRDQLRGRCHGIRAENCYGDAQFKRDVMDQDYLDQVEDRIRQKLYLARDLRLWTTGQWMFAFGNGLIKWRNLLLGALFGLALSIVALHHASDSTHRLAGIFGVLATRQNWHIIVPIMLFFIAGASFFASTAGKLVAFNLWGLFDFGRSWTSVLLFSLLMILAFGTAYLCLDGTQVALSGEAAGHTIWFYPWFVALMGFATLGIGTYVTPLTGWGAIIVMANVLSGFFTLGLLLSVLGNNFARRA